MSWPFESLRRHPSYQLLVRALLAAVAGVLLLLMADWRGHYHFGAAGTKDFIEYWCAGQLLRSGASPYDIDKLFELQAEQEVPPEDRVTMWNPPWLLVWLFPLLVLPFPWAALCWMVLNFILVLTSATLIWRTVWVKREQSENTHLGIAWVASLAFFPALIALQMGQVSSLVLLGVAGFVYCAVRNKDALAGAFLALTTIKPHLVYLLWIAVVWWAISERRYHRVLLGMAAFLLPTWGVLTLLWPNWLAGYAATMAEPPLHWMTPTLGTMLRLAIPIPQLQYLSSLLTGLGLLLYLVLRRPILDWSTAGGPLLLLSVPTAAYGWVFDQVVLLLPYLMIVAFILHPAGASKSAERTSGRWKVLAIFALGLMMLLMLVQNLIGKTGHWFFWMPWALGGVYLYTRSRAERRAQSAERGGLCAPRFALRALRSALCAPRSAIFLAIWLWLMLAGSGRFFQSSETGSNASAGQCHGAFGFFRDPGTFWHTVVGEQILSSGRFIHTDSFSFTCEGQPWIARQWLAECGMALLNRLGGMDGLLLGAVTLLALLYAWVYGRLIRAGMNQLLACLVVVLTMLASSYHFHPRPHLVTIALLGWSFARLSDFEAGRISVRSLYWLVPVFLVWANAHDGVLGGMGTLVLAASGFVFLWLVGWRSPIRDRRQILALAGLVSACGLTLVINPYGLEPLRTTYALLGSPVLPEVMAEHAPLWSRSVGWTVLLFGVVYLAALLGTFPPFKRLRDRELRTSSLEFRITWLIPLVWLALAWMRIRNGPLFAITAVIAVADMYPHIRWVAWLERHGSVVFRRRQAQSAERGGQSALPSALCVGLVVLAVICQGCHVSAPVVGRGWVHLDRNLWPIELLPELQARAAKEADSPGRPILNDMLFGGFLIYHTPGLRVFIDDRCELYGDEWLQAYAHVVRDDAGMVNRWVDQFGIELALTVPGTAIDRHLESSPQWQPVQRTTAANLYERVLGPSKSLRKAEY